MTSADPGPQLTAEPSHDILDGGPRKRSRALVVVLAALLLAVATAGAYATYHGRRSTPVRAATTPKPTPTAPPVSPEAYQHLLDQVDGDYTTLLAKLTSAPNVTELAQRTDQVKPDMTSALNRLMTTNPPAPVWLANQHLIQSLGTFTGDISNFYFDGDFGRACAGASVAADLVRHEGIERLRSAIQELATTDPTRAYRFGSFLPTGAAPPARRLANGARIVTPDHRGPDRLSIHNATPVDIVVSAVRANSTAAAFAFYVQTGHDFTMTGIPDGTYDIRFTGGEDWDPAARTFTRNCGYQRSAQPLAMNNTGYIFDLTEFDTGSSMEDAASFPA